MWANRITLDYIQHSNAKESIQEMLDKKGMTDENIKNLTIWHDAGYVMYKIVLSDQTCFSVFDCGVIFDQKDMRNLTLAEMFMQLK